MNPATTTVRRSVVTRLSRPCRRALSLLAVLVAVKAMPAWAMLLFSVALVVLAVAADRRHENAEERSAARRVQ